MKASTSVRLLAVCFGLLGPLAILAQERAIEDLRVSKTGDIASAEVILACQAGYLGHTPLNEQGEMQIRITLHPSCANSIGRQLRDELYRYPSGDLAHIREMQFETEDGAEAIVTVRFDAITAVSVNQGNRREVLTLRVDTGNLVADVPEPQSSPAPVIAPPRVSDAILESEREIPEVESFLEQRRDEVTTTETDRAPIRLVGPAPAGGPERYVVQLASGEIVQRPDLSGLVETTDPIRIYINQRTAGDRRWQELRVGFFTSEADAQVFQIQIATQYPDALIAVADQAEQSSAVALESNGNSGIPLADVPPANLENADSIFNDGRRALLQGENERSVQIFSSLVALQNYPRRNDALEFLGVAYERSGRAVDARAIYSAYLAEYSDDADALRIGQRLAGITASVNPAPSADQIEAPVMAQQRAAGTWDVRGGVSQYYRDDRQRLFDTAPMTTTQSALLSHVNLDVQRHGSRFDFQSRVNGVYVYDMLDRLQGTGEQGLVSRAYIGVVDKEKDWGVRLGRQSRYRSGILGRFDGVHGNYRFRPRVVMNVTAGSPVDTTRTEYSDRRQFFGISADLEQFVGKWDISVFTLIQQVDGIADREAIGGEAQYRSERWNIVTALDMDMGFGVVNSALLAANWRATEKLTFNARVDTQAAPFLTTRNAIIGQSVRTVEDLLGLYSENQIRRIARDRTAQANSATLGFSWPVFDRFQMNSNVIYTEFESTVASAGIDSVPNSDPQLYFSLNFIGSSLFRDGDTAIFEFRHNQTRTSETAGVIFDFRIPVGPRLRINPRLAISSRRYWLDWSTEWFAEPTVRLLMKIRQQHRFEVEVGGLWSSRDFQSIGGFTNTPDQETTGRFLNLGYWWEF